MNVIVRLKQKWRDKVGIYYGFLFFDESYCQLHRMLYANLFRLKENEEIR